VTKLSWRLVLILAVILTAVVLVLPTINPSVWPHKRIGLGLDLQGGMHLVLEVDTEKAVESTTERIALDLQQAMRKEHIRHGGIATEGSRIAIRIGRSQNMRELDAFLDRVFPELRSLSISEKGGFTTMVMSLPDSEQDRIEKSATQQALETIRNRIDQFGVSEPDIRTHGEKRILIQLPGITDTDRAKRLIGKTAFLELKLVDETYDVRSALEGNVPVGSQVHYQEIEDRETGRITKIPFLLKRRASLTGAYLSNARAQIESQYDEVSVSVRFDKRGARILEKLTERNTDKRIAFVLDDKVIIAPIITGKIPNGKGSITGGFSMAEAHDLAIVLRAGALPAPVSIIEERTVGPSLGWDSQRRGLVSMLIGSILVVAFMAVYYKVSGIIADIALLLNILLIAAGLAALEATLTLPGVAGIILTIGLAVDANVLVLERIREEMNLGKAPRAAVDAGYERSTLTILDSNVTTLIAALVLFLFGTGAVKGFAVTLSLGVTASLFTALIFTRSAFEYLLFYRKIDRLSI